MAYVHAFRTRAIIMQSPESSTELLNEAVTRVARIESGMSRIEQAMTLLRFALERLPEDDAPGRLTLLETVECCQDCLRTSSCSFA